jgi:hypothetical protein
LSTATKPVKKPTKKKTFKMPKAMARLHKKRETWRKRAAKLLRRNKKYK